MISVRGPVCVRDAEAVQKRRAPLEGAPNANVSVVLTSRYRTLPVTQVFPCYSIRASPDGYVIPTDGNEGTSGQTSQTG